jgi:hypothetical protein
VVEARDIIPLIVLGGLILLGRRREEAVPPPEEKPPIPQPWPPGLPILAPPREEILPPPPEEIVAPPEIPYPIEFLLPPPPRREVMPMAVAPPPPPREEILPPPPEVAPPVPPERIQLPQAPPVAVKLVVETEFTKSYEIILDRGDVVIDAYPLGAENTVISIYNIYTGEFKLRSFRAPEGYVVVSFSQSGNWDTGDYRAFIGVGVKRLYAVPWVYPPRPRYLTDYAVATGTGEVFIMGGRE